MIIFNLSLILTACSNTNDDNNVLDKQESGKTERQEVNENEITLDNDNKENGEIKAEYEIEPEADNEVVDLKLQLQKADEEAGVTIENNLIYSSLAEAIGADPKMGVENDFSLYPFDIAYFDDGSMSLVFLAINQLVKNNLGNKIEFFYL